MASQHDRTALEAVAQKVGRLIGGACEALAEQEGTEAPLFALLMFTPGEGAGRRGLATPSANP